MTKLKSGFPRWWHCFGSGMVQGIAETHEDHVRRVAEAAYNKGKQDAINASKIRRDKRLVRLLLVVVALLGIAGGAKLVTALADSYESRTKASLTPEQPRRKPCINQPESGFPCNISSDKIAG